MERFYTELAARAAATQVLHNCIVLYCTVTLQCSDKHSFDVMFLRCLMSFPSPSPSAPWSSCCCARRFLLICFCAGLCSWMRPRQRLVHNSSTLIAHRLLTDGAPMAHRWHTYGHARQRRTPFVSRTLWSCVALFVLFCPRVGPRRAFLRKPLPVCTLSRYPSVIACDEHGRS